MAVLAGLVEFTVVVEPVFSTHLIIGAVLVTSTACLEAILALAISGVVWYSLARIASCKVVYPSLTGFHVLGWAFTTILDLNVLISLSKSSKVVS